MPRPKALFISPIFPARTGNGLAMRQGMFLEALAKIADTELLTLPIMAPPADDQALATELGIPASLIATAGRADTHFVLLSMLAAPAERLAAFRAYGRGSRHADLSFAVLSELRARMAGRSFDLVHAGRLYVSEAALAVDALRTLDLDEDDAWAWRREAELHRLAGREDEARWCEQEAAAERALLGRVAGSFAASFIAGDSDRDRLRADHPHLSPEIVANGVPFPANIERRDDGRTMLFVGTLGYRPNVDGLIWFADEVLPRIAAQFNIRLRIVGRGLSEALAALAGRPQIEMVGAVDDITPSYAQATLAIAPLHSGGGTRIKLIEAAAHRVPIISTTIGAQGLGLADDMLWRADTPAAFAAAICDALREGDERERRALRAYEHLRLTHSRDGIVNALACRFEAILAKAASRPS